MNEEKTRTLDGSDEFGQEITLVPNRESVYFLRKRADLGETPPRCPCQVITRQPDASRLPDSRSPRPHPPITPASISLSTISRFRLLPTTLEILIKLRDRFSEPWRLHSLSPSRLLRSVHTPTMLNLLPRTATLPQMPPPP